MVGLFHNIYLFHIVFSSVLPLISLEMLEVSVEKSLLMLRGYPEAEIFAPTLSFFLLSALVCGSVGARKPKSGYRRWWAYDKGVMSSFFLLEFWSVPKCSDFCPAVVENVRKFL